MANTKITNPELFNLGDSTSATQLPVMTTTQRIAMTGLSTGEMIFNSDTDKVEYWDGTKWYGITYELQLESPYNNVIWSGNGSSSRSNTGLGFQPDLVWVKARQAQNHTLYDSIRGTGKYLASDTANSENSNTTYGQLTSFDADGFTGSLGSNGTYSFFNSSSQTYVAWCFKAGGAAVANTDGSIASQVSANVAGGFSIVKWTGLGNAGQTVGHGLSDAPELIITKVLNINGENWYTYSYTAGNDKFLTLNKNSSAQTAQQAGYSSGASFWNNTSPTNDVFSLGNIAEIMSYNHIAYCFHSVAGYSKVGSYTGTGANMTVDVGFQPAFVMIKNTTNSASWHIFDNKRTAANPSTEALFPNENSAGADYNTVFVFTSTGFNNKVTSTSLNSNGSNYIYLAFA